jgi:hypothetical protein
LFRQWRVGQKEKEKPTVKLAKKLSTEISVRGCQVLGMHRKQKKTNHNAGFSANEAVRKTATIFRELDSHSGKKLRSFSPALRHCVALEAVIKVST